MMLWRNFVKKAAASPTSEKQKNGAAETAKPMTW
jgi:hypothetical protein